MMISTALSQMGRSKVTMAASSPESLMHSLRMVKMVLWSLGSPSMTGRKSTCVLSFASSAWILLIQPFQLEYWNSGSLALITHPDVQSVSPGERSGCSCATEEARSAIERNVMASIPVCFLFVNGRILTSAALRTLALSSVFNFTLLITVFVRSSPECGAGEVTFIKPIE